MMTIRRTAAVIFFIFCGLTAALAQPSPGGTPSGFLQSWSFDDANWLSDSAYSPIGFTNITNVSGGDGQCLSISATNAFLQYNVVESDGTTNLVVDTGSFTVWINPNWASTNITGGTGPGTYARVIEVGTFSTNATTEWWSLYFSPDGCNLLLSAEAGGTLTNYIAAPVSFASNAWENIAVTYSATNTALYINGFLAGDGPGMTVYPGSTTLSNGFFVGSDSSGSSQFNGLMDDLVSYNIELDSTTVFATYDVFAAAYSGAVIISENPTNAPSVPSEGSTFDAITGPGFLQNIGSSTNCVTGSQVYFTNFSCVLTTNNGATITFTITGGTNNAVYDVFGTTTLDGTNTQWYWLGQGTNCGVYQLPAQSLTSTCYVLGTLQDSDKDGLTDAYELLVSKTDPNNGETFYDGLSDGWNVLYGVNPLSPTNVPTLRLGYWRFNTNSWVGEQGQTPISTVNLSSAASWSGNAVVVTNTGGAKLVYRDREPYGFDNICLRNGSARLWIQPGWTTGTGPGNWASLIEMGGTNSELWSLRISPAGDTLALVTQAGGVTTTNVTTSLSWNAGEWHQVVATWSPDTNGTALYVDGELGAIGSALLHYPSAATRANGMSVGGTLFGTGQVAAAIDELETFNYLLDATTIANNYNGLTTLTPVPIASFTNDFVTTSTTVASISGAAAQMTVLVNSTNIASATWSLFSSNCTVNLGSGDGARMVVFGFTSMDGSVTNWVGQTVTVDTVPPVLTITNPASSNTFQPMIQLQGYANEPLSSLAFDVTNAAGIITNQQGFPLSRYYDTNLLVYTTNWFQCFDIVLTNGVNTITVRATDRAGNVTTNSYSYTLTAGTNAPTLSAVCPQDGMKLSGSAFTLDGQVDNYTAAIAVSMTDGNGNTNTYNGLVERNGRFWVENLPLNSGTNGLTLNAVDYWGNSTTTNLAVTQSALALTATADPTQLYNSNVTVTGTVSDSSYGVTVNGVSATNDGSGNWTATNVPVNSGGTATFNVVAQNSLSDTVNAKLDEDKPDRLYVSEDTLNLTNVDDIYSTGPGWSNDRKDTRTAQQDWKDSSGGTASLVVNTVNTNSDPTGDWTCLDSASVAWTPTFWPNLITADVTNNLECSNPTMDLEDEPTIGWYHIDVSSGCPAVTTTLDGQDTFTYTKKAQTTVTYFTGGKDLPGATGDIFEFDAAAWQIPGPLDSPPYDVTQLNEIPPQSPSGGILVGALGPVGNDGVLWTQLPSGQALNATPQTPGNSRSTFNVNATKHQMFAWCYATVPTNQYRTNIGVGEHVKVYFAPAVPPTTRWSINDNGSTIFPSGPSLDFYAPNSANPDYAVTATFPHSDNVPMTVNFNVLAPTGVDHAVIISSNNVDPNNPGGYQLGHAGAEMKLVVFMAPTNVSLARVQIAELLREATDISGYFADTNRYPNPPTDLEHITAQQAGYFSLGPSNQWVDRCWSGDLAQIWTNGSFTWQVPWDWTVPGGGSRLIGANPTPGWTQVFSLTNDGTVTITKFGHFVTRQTNGVITAK